MLIIFYFLGKERWSHNKDKDQENWKKKVEKRWWRIGNELRKLRRKIEAQKWTKTYMQKSMKTGLYSL